MQFKGEPDCKQERPAARYQAGIPARQLFAAASPNGSPLPVREEGESLPQWGTPGGRRWVSSLLAMLSLLCIPVVGLIDFKMGPEISLALFYVPPVAMTAWFGGRRLGLIAAFASALAWFTTGIPKGAQLSHPLIHCWNAASRLLIYSFLALLVAAVRQRRDQLQRALEQKNARLELATAECALAEREVIDACAREQRRIAYDLHDDLGQNLVGLAFKAKLLGEKLRPSHPEEAEEAVIIARLANEAARQTRLTARKLDDADGAVALTTALPRLAAAVRKNCRVKVTVNTSACSLPVSAPVAMQLYRIAQEAVHNAVEHGRARVVEIYLVSHQEHIVLSVRQRLWLRCQRGGARNGFSHHGLPRLGHRWIVRGTITRPRHNPHLPRPRPERASFTPVKEKSSGRQRARVLVIDDHPVLRDGLMQMICGQPDLECTGMADNTSDAKRLVEQSAPDLMILDLRLKSGDALDLIKSLRVEHPELKVLVLSQCDEMIFAERVLRAGADGYLMKENATEEILHAVRTVLAGEIYFSRQIGASFVRRSIEQKPAVSRAGIERLSDRELQVFQLIGASFSTREIAEQFNLSIKTVESHRENLKSKLGLQSAAALNEFAENWVAQNYLPR